MSGCSTGKLSAMKKSAFKLRLAYRNLTGKNILFSLAVYFLLLVLLSLALIAFSHRAMIKKLYYYQAKEKYQKIDLVLTYDENSPVKIVNQRNLSNYRDYFSYYETFYNFYSVIESDEEVYYGQVFSSDMTGFRRVIDYPAERIAEDEAIVSASLAAASGLEEGDSFILFLGAATREFRIKSVAPDRGIFTGNAVFVLKDELLREIIGPGTTNLGNTVYFKLKSGVKVEDALNALASDEEYGKFRVDPAVDYEYIDYYVRYGSSIFMAVGLIVFIALLLVIRSIFSLYFKDFNSQYAVINILGGSRGFAFQIWIFQLLLLSVLALPPAIGLCQWFFNLAARVFLVKSHIALPAESVLLAFISYLIVLAYELVSRYLWLRRESLVSLSKDNKSAPAFDRYALLFLLLLYVVNNIFSPFGAGIKAVVNIMMLAAAAVLAVGLIVRLACLASGRVRKKTIFNLFTAKHLNNNKIISHSLRVMTIALMIIAAVLSVTDIIDKNSASFRKKIEADYMIANISDYKPGLKREISDFYPVEDVEEAVFFQNVYIKEYAKGVPIFLSLEYDNIDRYFSLEIGEEIADKLGSAERLYALLPESFKQIYGAAEGDVVTLKLSATLGEEEFVVAGFYQTEYEIFIFSNYLAYSGEDATNALLFNTNPYFDDANKADIVKRYGSKMYFLVDIAKTVDVAFDAFDNIIKIVFWLFWFIAGGFAVVIVNNLLLALSYLKADYARLRVLGLDDRQLTRVVVTEAAAISFVVFVIAFVALSLIIPNFAPMMLVFGYYKELAVTGVALLKFLALGTLVFIPGYLIYCIRIKYINIIDTIRKF